MKRTMLSLLVAVGIFVAIEVLIGLIGVGVMLTHQHLDSNGITMSPDAGIEAGLATWTGIGTVAGAILAAVGAVVFGLQPHAKR